MTFRLSLSLFGDKSLFFNFVLKNFCSPIQKKKKKKKSLHLLREKLESNFELVVVKLSPIFCSFTYHLFSDVLKLVL